MFCQKTLYLNIEKIPHKTIRIILQSNASYQDLLECTGSTSIHQRHVQFLFTEIYKSTVTTNLRFMWHFLREREVPYNLRKGDVLFLLLARPSIRGTSSVQFSWHTNLESATKLNKSSNSIIEFKTNFKELVNIGRGGVENSVYLFHSFFPC